MTCRRRQYSSHEQFANRIRFVELPLILIIYFVVLLRTRSEKVGVKAVAIFWGIVHSNVRTFSVDCEDTRQLLGGICCISNFQHKDVW